VEADCGGTRANGYRKTAIDVVHEGVDDDRQSRTAATRLAYRLVDCLTVKNTGTTPALDVRAFGLVRTIAGSEEPPFVSDVPPLPAPGMFGPGIEMSILFAMPSIPEGDTLYVYGNVEYGDIFGGQHWTEFCGKYVPKTIFFTWCTGHNGVGSRETPTAAR
jgi:hypothetical protein